MKQCFLLLLRFCAVLALTVPLAIAFQVAGMLLTGWGIQGFAWLAVGAFWIPTALACSWYLIELRNVKQAVLRGVALGFVASLTLLLLVFGLLLAAGPMDGGI